MSWLFTLENKHFLITEGLKLSRYLVDVYKGNI